MEPTKRCECGKLMIQVPEDRIVTRGLIRQQAWSWECFACDARIDGGVWQFKHELEGKRWREVNGRDEDKRLNAGDIVRHRHTGEIMTVMSGVTLGLVKVVKDSEKGLAQSDEPMQSVPVAYLEFIE